MEIIKTIQGWNLVKRKIEEDSNIMRMEFKNNNLSRKLKAKPSM